MVWIRWIKWRKLSTTGHTQNVLRYLCGRKYLIVLPYKELKKNLKICRKKLGENRKFYNYSLPTEMEIWNKNLPKKIWKWKIEVSKNHQTSKFTLFTIELSIIQRNRNWLSENSHSEKNIEIKLKIVFKKTFAF
jgi:hypothetical protein